MTEKQAIFTIENVQGIGLGLLRANENGRQREHIREDFRSYRSISLL